LPPIKRGEKRKKGKGGRAACPGICPTCLRPIGPRGKKGNNAASPFSPTGQRKVLKVFTLPLSPERKKEEEKFFISHPPPFWRGKEKKKKKEFSTAQKFIGCGLVLPVDSNERKKKERGRGPPIKFVSWAKWMNTP